jgi:hypothetical protein
MPLVATTVKLESDKLELIKMKQVNVSQLCRDAVDSYLKLNSTDKAVIKSQIADLQQQRNSIDLQIKLLLKQLEACEEEDVLSTHRNAMFDKWKTNLAFMVNKKTIDWGTVSDVFKFSTRAECEAYIINRLKEEGLIT